MRKIFFILISPIIIFFVILKLDNYIYNHINSILKNKKSEHYTKAHEFKIQWDQKFPQGCEFKHIYYFYPYQTCFIRGKRKELQGVNSALFVVTGPPRIFAQGVSSFPGRTQDSRRFTIPVRTDASVEIYENGKINCGLPYLGGPTVLL